MPEGPEIRRAVDQLAHVLRGERPSRLFFAFDELKPYESQLAGDRIVDVESRSKAVLIHFEQGLTIYSHNQLYGTWRVTRAGHRPETTRQLRLALDTSDHAALLYSASDIEVLDDQGLAEHSYLRRLGPEVLNEAVSARAVAERLSSAAFRRRRLPGVLLDQKCLAGLGNYLRCEIMFLAGIAPEHRAMDLSEARLTRLSQEVLSVTRRAYRTGGVTLRDELSERLEAHGVARRQRRHYVYGRQGDVCRVCEASVERVEAGGRGFFYCPQCQS